MPKIEVTISNIIDYIGNKMRPLKEGEAIYKAGHIIMCGVDVEQTHVIKSLCLQTSALTQPPHEITIIPQNNELWKCQCSCKAGNSGFCKHVIGTLIYINRNEDLDYISCTDLTQKWGKEKKGVEDMYKAKPFNEFCHPLIKKQKVHYHITEAVTKENFNILSVASGNSSISKFLGRTLEMPVIGMEEADSSSYRNTSVQMENHSSAKDRCSSTSYLKKLLKNAEDSHFLRKLSEMINLDYSNLKQCCQDILETIKGTDIMKVALDYPQGSDLWKKERQLRITGSNCYSIYTYQKDSWESKSVSFFFPKGFSNKFTQHGIKFESEAIKLFEMKNKNYDIFQPNLIVSKKFPWLAFSPAGIIFHEGKPWRLIEVKCPYMGKENDSNKFVDLCNFLTIDGSRVQLKVKHPYYGQVQLGMALLNLKETHFLVYSSFSSTYLEVMVKFDEIFSQELINNISTKYFNNMLHYYCMNK